MRSIQFGRVDLILIRTRSHLPNRFMMSTIQCRIGSKSVCVGRSLLTYLHIYHTTNRLRYKIIMDRDRPVAGLAASRHRCLRGLSTSSMLSPSSACFAPALASSWWGGRHFRSWSAGGASSPTMPRSGSSRQALAAADGCHHRRLRGGCEWVPTYVIDEEDIYMRHLGFGFRGLSLSGAFQEYFWYLQDWWRRGWQGQMQ